MERARLDERRDGRLGEEVMQSTSQLVFVVCAISSAAAVRPARADLVTDWNENTQQAIATAVTAPAATARVFAIVHAAVFDAVNGIHGRYAPYHVDFEAPNGASRRAAAVQAAYAALVKLFPAQKAALEAKRMASLAAIEEATEADDSEECDGEDAESVARGIAWGQAVVDDILAWRNADGFSVA